MKILGFEINYIKKVSKIDKLERRLEALETVAINITKALDKMTK
jgi:hypothetical protein